MRVPVDLGDPGLIHIERQHLHDRCCEEVVLFHKPAHAVIQLGALGLGASDLRAREPHALFDVPDDGVLHLVPFRLEQRAVRGREVVRAQHLEDLVGVREIRLSVFDDQPHVFEDLALRLQDFGHAWIDRQSTQVAAPRQADILEVALERPREDRSRFSERDAAIAGRARRSP